MVCTFPGIYFYDSESSRNLMEGNIDMEEAFETSGERGTVVKVAERERKT